MLNFLVYIPSKMDLGCLNKYAYPVFSLAISCYPAPSLVTQPHPGCVGA